MTTPNEVCPALGEELAVKREKESDVAQANFSYPTSCSAIGREVWFSAFSREEQGELQDVMQCNLVASKASSWSFGGSNR